MKKIKQIKNNSTSLNKQFPNHWKECELGEVVNCKNSSLSISSIENSNGKYPLYGAGGLLQSINFYEQEEKYIAIVKDGAGVGKVMIGSPKSSVLGTMSYLFPSKDIDFNFLFYILQNITYEKYITGSTIPHIYFKNYSCEKILLPSYHEQQKIANILTAWDDVIQKTQLLLEHKLKTKKWLVRNLLSGKRRISGFNNRWREYSINDLFQPSYRYIDWDENTLYKLISIRRRFGGLFYRGDLYGKEISVKKLKSIHTGDFLISKRQVSHGAWAVVTKEFHNGKVSDEYDCLTVKNKKIISTEFWTWYCQQEIMKHYAYLDSTGVHIEKLIFNFDLFGKRKIMIPDTIEEQVEISKILSTANEEIELIKAKYEKFKIQKKILIQQLLAGKKRVKLKTK